MSAVSLVHVQNGVGGGSRTIEGVKNKCIHVSSNLQNSLVTVKAVSVLKTCHPISNIRMASFHFCGILYSSGALEGVSCSAHAAFDWFRAGAFRRNQSRY